MKSGNSAIAKRSLVVLSLALAMAAAILSGVNSPAALADDGEGLLGNDNKPDRTIMIYLDGAASEEKTPVLTAMLKEYMASKFDRSGFRIIVMTGGSLKWHLEASYLRDKDGNPGTLTEISSEYNQVWEVHGANDGGYLRLLDGDGVSGDGADAKRSEEELMSDPDTLRKFINYAHAIAPAGKYDLILNDHGEGPQGGYGFDDHDTENPGETLSVLELRQAISGSDVCAGGGKFDFVDFDCCMMGNFETALALSDCTDYYLGSADIDPHATVDYTALFDFLATDPGMDAWELGRRLVDLFADYYDENPDKVSVGPSDTYCVVDANRLKQSGVVGKLLAIARQMRAEATAGSFYDEIRVPKDAYHFALVNLQDFATVVEQLGIGLYESDWQEPGFLNAYTATALEIQSILHDEGIVYSRHTSRSDEAHVFFGRSDEGGIEARGAKSPTSGLSIFAFNNPSEGDVSGEVAFYIQAMGELSGAYEEGSTERELLETYLQAVLDYELICNAGVAVSSLAEGGCAPDEIDYDRVLAYLRSQESEHIKRGWEYISKAFEASDRDVEAWLSGIIGIQRKEVLSNGKVSLKTESKDGADRYRIDVADTPKRVVDVPVLTVTAGTAVEPFKNPAMAFYGSAASDATGGSSEDYMTKTNSSYVIPKFDGQWYAVEDSEGARHIASAASDHSVFASFSLVDDENPNGKNLGVGELVFDDDGNAKSIYVYGNTIPIALDTLEGMVLVTLENDPFGGASGAIDMPFTLEKTNAKLVKDTCSNLGINDVEVKLAISDMYGVEHGVNPELAFDPNGGTWAEGGDDVRRFDAGLEADFEIIAAPTRDGYTFECWEGSAYQPGQQYHADGDHAFTAKWKKNEPEPAPTWKRLWGQDAYGTMGAIAAEGWESSDTVVLATFEGFWDALSASSLSGQLDAPVLLTYKDSLQDQAAREIERLGAKTVYIVGGPDAVGDGVKKALEARKLAVERVWGQDAIETAEQVALKAAGLGARPDTCIVATFVNFQDALAASPYAYASRAPIYLTLPDGTLDADTLAQIEKAGYANAVVVGGPLVVDKGVEGALAGAGVGKVERAWGADSLLTSIEFAKWARGKGMGLDGMAVATAATFQDALTGGPLCGRNNSVLTLVLGDQMPVVGQLVKPNKDQFASGGYIFGGTAAVPESVEKALNEAIT